MNIKPISISLSPNTQRDDILLAFKLLFQPWKWKKGKQIKEFEGAFKNYLGLKYAVSFNSGRSSLVAILNALNFEEGSEVLLQAFSCNAAANPILWSGFQPIYVDVKEDTFNMDAEDLKKKITKKSKAVIIQHTFGRPAEIDKIAEICKMNNLILIEDCAHSLGSEYRGKKVGTFSDVSFFSFSRDKVVSSVYGGMAVTDNKLIAENLLKFQDNYGYPSGGWIFQQLLHPVLMNLIILPTYKILGKYLLVLLQWTHILSKAVHWKEKRGMAPGYFPKRLPNALAILALNQFRKLDKFNKHRKEIVDFYVKELSPLCFQLPTVTKGDIFLRFTLKHPMAHKIIEKAWSENLLIGDWYTTAIAPHDTRLEAIRYHAGSCPMAEKLARETFNLPTHINISKNDAKIIIRFLNKHKW
jgi:dTDP-4-amino-4,6-dideoxygalactose transaminase